MATPRASRKHRSLLLAHNQSVVPPRAVFKVCRLIVKPSRTAGAATLKQDMRYGLMFQRRLLSCHGLSRSEVKTTPRWRDTRKNGDTHRALNTVMSDCAGISFAPTKFSKPCHVNAIQRMTLNSEPVFCKTGTRCKSRHPFRRIL